MNFSFSWKSWFPNLIFFIMMRNMDTELIAMGKNDKISHNSFYRLFFAVFTKSQFWNIKEQFWESIKDNKMAVKTSVFLLSTFPRYDFSWLPIMSYTVCENLTKSLIFQFGVKLKSIWFFSDFDMQFEWLKIEFLSWDIFDDFHTLCLIIFERA